MKKILSFVLATIITCSIPLTAMAAEPNTVKISIAGDATLGEYKGQGAGNQFKDFYDKEGAGWFFENVKSIFAADDITFVNLEGALTNHSQVAQKTYPIKGDVRNVNVLLEGSVETVNLSNNHIYDCGTDGFKETVDVLEKNNIGRSGEGYVQRITKNGINVDFFGYSGWSYTDGLKSQIQNDLAASDADIKIVEYHWGVEREYKHNSTQESIAHWTIDCGADLVVGAHPHVLQDTEIYNGKLIAYSLGNFCFGANKNPNDKDTAILSITFTKAGDYTFEFIPCRISSVTNMNDYKPTIVTDEESIARIKRKLNQ